MTTSPRPATRPVGKTRVQGLAARGRHGKVPAVDVVRRNLGGRGVTHVVWATLESSASSWAAVAAADDHHPRPANCCGPVYCALCSCGPRTSAYPGSGQEGAAPRPGRADDRARHPVPGRGLCQSGLAGSASVRRTAVTRSGVHRQVVPLLVAGQVVHHVGPAGSRTAVGGMSQPGGRRLGRGEQSQRGPHVRPRAAGVSPASSRTYPVCGCETGPTQVVAGRQARLPPAHDEDVYLVPGGVAVRVGGGGGVTGPGRGPRRWPRPAPARRGSTPRCRASR